MYRTRFLIICALAFVACTGAKAGSPPQPAKSPAPVSAAMSAKTSGVALNPVPLKHSVTAGTVNVATRKLDLDRLSLSDFGDVEQQTR